VIVRAKEVRRVVLTVWEYEKWSAMTSNPASAVEGRSAATRVFFNQNDVVIGDYCNCLMGWALVNRIILALRRCSTPIEAESQKLSAKVIDLYSTLGIRQDLYAIHSLRIAHSILATASSWEDRVSSVQLDVTQPASQEVDLISANVFEEFDELVCSRR